MPELPEVEHIRMKLDRWMRGRRIAAIQTTDARIVRPVPPRTFIAELRGRTVVRVERRGKWLRLVLDDRRSVFSHLGMTGWFERRDDGNGETAALRFERVGFDLEAAPRGGARGKTHIAYVDARRWGRLWLAGADEEVAAWTALGPDPLGDGVDVGALATKLARRKKRSIKEVLLDQSVLAGVGNIQAIEALWKAKIDPRSPAGALAGDAASVRAIVAGLRWTIARTLVDLEKNDGMDGDSPFRIYGRKGTPCPRCRTTLERITLGGRSTTFCPGCQALKGSGAGRGSGGRRSP